MKVEGFYFWFKASCVCLVGETFKGMRIISDNKLIVFFSQGVR